MHYHIIFDAGMGKCEGHIVTNGFKSMISLHFVRCLSIVLQLVSVTTILLQWSNSSTCTIEMTPSDSTTMCLSGLGSNGNEDIFHILYSFRAGASPSNGLMSYQGH